MDNNITTEPAASSSSPSSHDWEYDVFLSFRGADTRFSFVDHLYNSLLNWGINTFRDDDQLRYGQDLPREISKAIEKSRISVVVFSKNYASSTWCLDELAKIIECKNSKQQIVLPIFYDVEPSDVRKQRGPFHEAFDEHESRFKDDLEKVKIWRAALTEAANLSGFVLDKYGSESKFISEINEEISRLLKHVYLTYETDYLVGIDSRIREMNDLLGVGAADVRMVGIWGICGMGKTTLAQAVYNSVAHKFEGSCFLGNVRENSEAPGGLVQLQKTLLDDILGMKTSSLTNVGSGVDIIKSRLRRKRVLLIIDDVDQLDPLKYLAGSSDWFGAGSRIIISARDEHLLLAHKVDFTYQVKELESEEAMELFNSKAFPTSRIPNDYLEPASRVVGYAQGNPLALTAMGSLLCGKSIDEWHSIIERYERAPASNIHEILKITKKVHELQSKRLNEEDEEDGEDGEDEEEEYGENEGEEYGGDDEEYKEYLSWKVGGLQADVDVVGLNVVGSLDMPEADKSEADDVDGVEATETSKSSPGEDEISPDTQKKDQLGDVTGPSEVENSEESPEGDTKQTEGMAELALSAETWLSTAKSFLFKADTVDWTFLIISFFLEILAAICDQFFSPGNPHFALTGMWLASVALFFCICELILKCKKGESSSPRLEMFPDIFGLICGISQWLSTIARFVCTLKGMENPFKVNLLPVIFLGCLVARKLIANDKRCKTENRIELTSIVHVSNHEPTPDEAQAKKGS